MNIEYKITGSLKKDMIIRPCSRCGKETLTIWDICDDCSPKLIGISQEDIRKLSQKKKSWEENGFKVNLDTGGRIMMNGEEF